MNKHSRKTNNNIEVLESRIAPAFAAAISVASLNGTNGFHIDGANANDLAGYSVAEAGDVNGDGFSDIIIGAPGAATNTGEAFVVFGKASGIPTDLNLSALTASKG